MPKKCWHAAANRLNRSVPGLEQHNVARPSPLVRANIPGRALAGHAGVLLPYRHSHTALASADSDFGSRGQHSCKGVVSTRSATLWTVQVRGSCDKIPVRSGNQDSRSWRVRTSNGAKSSGASCSQAMKCVRARKRAAYGGRAAVPGRGRGASGWRCRQGCACDERAGKVCQCSPHVVMENV